MVVKHNRPLQNAHFRKHWQRYTKLWFDQTAKAAKRKFKRKEKLAREAPRPLGALRPLVRPPSLRHNMKLRVGRGFTLEELKAVGVSRKVAPTIGIAVDPRRSNKSEESLQRNVLRLKDYMSRLVVFPRKGGKLKKGFGGMPDDTSKTELSKYKAMPIAKFMPGVVPNVEIKARAVTEEDRAFSAFEALKKARWAAKPPRKQKHIEAAIQRDKEDREARAAARAAA